MMRDYKKFIFAGVAIAIAVLGGFFLAGGFAPGQGGQAGADSVRVLPPLATSTPQTTTASNGMRLYASEAFHFSLPYPQELQVTQYAERDNAMTVTFVSPDHTQEFEVYVTPYQKAQIDGARFKLDQPSGTYLNPQDVVIDGTAATMFYGRNGIMGDTREVWFIRGGFLYEVATYKELDPWLARIMQGWKFI